MPLLKTCKTCKVTKNISAFYRQLKGLLGRTGSCKNCRLQKQAQYQKTEKGKELQRINSRKRDHTQRNIEFKKKNPNYWKEYYKQNRKIRLDGNKRFWEKHPERYELYKIYQKAKYNGLLKPSDNCQICGIKTKTQGHHFDYSKPLQVTWVCAQCHKDIHKKHWFIKRGIKCNKSN